MDALLAEIESLALVQYLRFGQWSYAAANTAHVLGIALLVGSILPLDLRLLGAWRDVPRSELVQVLVPFAAGGLALAVMAGLTLFSVQALEYAEHPLMLIKLGLVMMGTAGALLLHARFGFLLEGASERRLAVHAGISMTCWIGALILGRLIAFVE